MPYVLQACTPPLASGSARPPSRRGIALAFYATAKSSVQWSIQH
jgi:hypothetical protein